LRFTGQKQQVWVPEDIINEMGREFFDEYYTPTRLKNKIWEEVIASDTPTIRGYQGLDPVHLRVIRLIDPVKFPLSVEISLYGRDRIGIMSYKDQLGLIIESESISKTLKSIFALQWEALGENK